MRVSVGKVENLREASEEIATFMSHLREAARMQEAELSLISSEVLAELNDSARRLIDAKKRMQQAKEAWNIAKTSLTLAREGLAAAVAALAACVAATGGAACAGLVIAEENARKAVNVAKAAEKAACANYGAKCLHFSKMARRMAIADKAYRQTKNLEERVRGQLARHFHSCQDSAEIAHSRLAAASSALEDYLASSPPVMAFSKWLGYSPDSHSPATPAHLLERVRLSVEQQGQLYEYLVETDSAFRKTVESYRRAWDNARGDAERAAVMLKARRYLAGTCGEKLVEHAFKPYCESISTQDRTYMSDGRYTKTDLIFHGMKVPLILGKGEGRYVPKGGSLAVEVKCGSDRYLLSQSDHMSFQANGHRRSSASVTICTANIKNLSEEEEERLRETMHGSGSPLLAILPRKEDIDRAVLELIINGGK